MSIKFATAASAVAFIGTDAKPTLPQLCFSGCENGSPKSWWQKFECTCNDGWSGECCDEATKCSAKELPLFDIDATEFTRATWYAQRQQEAPFQTRENFYCTTATYDATSSHKAKLIGASITASNANTLNSVDGAVSSVVLCGGLGDGPGKLKVSPCTVFRVSPGDLWVLDVGVNAEDNSKYDWAIVISGQPTDIAEDGKCVADLGMWMYTREQNVSQDVIDAMYASLEKNEISGSKLFPVVQEGCKYNDRRIKDGVDDGKGPAIPFGLPGTDAFIGSNGAV
jgi:hypothetical protein